MYLIDSSSPLVPGARPSNSSDERILMWASNASGVMTSSAGLSFSSGVSAAKRVNAASVKSRGVAFISLKWIGFSEDDVKQMRLRRQIIIAFGEREPPIDFPGTDRQALSRDARRAMRDRVTQTRTGVDRTRRRSLFWRHSSSE